jgi:hypothetical protein
MMIWTEQYQVLIAIDVSQNRRTSSSTTFTLSDDVRHLTYLDFSLNDLSLAHAATASRQAKKFRNCFI